MRTLILIFLLGINFISKAQDIQIKTLEPIDPKRNIIHLNKAGDKYYMITSESYMSSNFSKGSLDIIELDSDFSQTKITNCKDFNFQTALFEYVLSTDDYILFFVQEFPSKKEYIYSFVQVFFDGRIITKEINNLEISKYTMVVRDVKVKLSPDKSIIGVKVPVADKKVRLMTFNATALTLKETLDVDLNEKLLKKYGATFSNLTDFVIDDNSDMALLMTGLISYDGLPTSHAELVYISNNQVKYRKDLKIDKMEYQAGALFFFKNKIHLLNVLLTKSKRDEDDLIQLMSIEESIKLKKSINGNFNDFDIVNYNSKVASDDKAIISITKNKSEQLVYAYDIQNIFVSENELKCVTTKRGASGTSLGFSVISKNDKIYNVYLSQEKRTEPPFGNSSEQKVFIKEISTDKIKCILDGKTSALFNVAYSSGNEYVLPLINDKSLKFCKITF